MIDVQQMQSSLVINYELPVNKENYLHRIGRTGHYGPKCWVINFITRADVVYLKDIETFYLCEIPEMPSNIADLIKIR